MRSHSDLDPRRRTATTQPPAPVPLMDPQRVYAAWGAEAASRVQDILRSHAYVAGPHVAALERDLAEHLGVEHAIAVDSGTDALWLALRAWFEQFPPERREVIVPAFTFVATASAVVSAGGIPVFADVDRDTYLIDPASVAERLSPRTAAIVPVHLFGLPVDLAPLRALAPDVPLLEDAAQAIEATWRGDDGTERFAGNLGDAATFSFYPSKNLAAAGDGGLVATSDDHFAMRVRALRTHGQTQRGEPSRMVGTNSRMDEIQAAVLGCKLPHLATWTEQRRAVAARYDAAFAGLPLHTPATPDRARSAWHLYTIRLPDGARRDAVQAALRTAGVGTGIYYRRPIHHEPCFAPFAPAPCPVADDLSETVLSLPCFPGLRADEQERVIAAVSEAIRQDVPRTVG